MLYKVRCMLRPTVESGPEFWSGKVYINLYLPDGKKIGRTETMLMKDGKTPPLGSEHIPFSSRLVLNQFTDRFEDMMILLKVKSAWMGRKRTLGTCYLNLGEALKPHPSMQSTSKLIPFVFDSRHQALMRVHISEAHTDQIMEKTSSFNSALSRIPAFRKTNGGLASSTPPPRGYAQL
eukprot:ANDGO_07619.mRNA.1 hypothetical protein